MKREQRTGKYIHKGGWDRLCKCGHRLGEHSAEKVAGKRPCIANEFAMLPMIECSCENFRPAKK